MNVEQRRKMIADWFFREFGPAWLELAGLGQQAEDARTHGMAANWIGIVQTAKTLAHKANEEISQSTLLGWTQARLGSARAGAEASHLAGADIADEIASAPHYQEVIDAVSAALNALVFRAAYVAAAQAILAPRSHGVLPFLWSYLVSGSAKKEAIQAAYEAAYARMRPTAEKLHSSANELLRALKGMT